MCTTVEHNTEQSNSEILNNLDLYQRMDGGIESDWSMVAIKIKWNQFKSQVRLGFADVPQRLKLVHDEAEIQTHGYIFVSDGGHRSTLLTTEPM